MPSDLRRRVLTTGAIAYAPLERRKSVRFGTTIPATILLGDGVAPIPCTVLDVSMGGGRVRLDADGKVPDRFTLVLTAAGTVQRSCRVIWRKDDLLGLAFSGHFDPV
jgi:hypothetical protein